uniref:Methyltransferase-like protein 22 n=1 Tax=Timema genevievae TaxID=629358 RepID=A0A7R9JR61_TIMGE|nr:unnamed protein product [Timema genevievae]
MSKPGRIICSRVSFGMSVGNDYLITSEIQELSKRDDTYKPIVAPENVVSVFTFKYPLQYPPGGIIKEPTLDEDGDLIVQRLPETAQGIIAIDVNNGGILDLIRGNAKRNHKFIKAKFSVVGLDFFAKEWSKVLSAKLSKATVVLAADVIYDNDLTEAFVETLVKILNTPPAKTVYIALEKRYVFTVADLDTGAPCYEHFLRCLDQARSHSLASLWSVEQLAIDFPQYFNYDRVKELVLWKIHS